MTREEALKVLGNLSDELKGDCVDGYITRSQNEWADEIIEAIERVNEPITLAEFLGWEEGIEYGRGGNILKVEGNHLLDKRPTGKFYNTNCSTAELIDLRNATKFEPKYYAKIKGWKLIPSDYYYFGLDDNHDLEIKDACDAYEFTKTEWAELGVTDENADFERMEE